MYSALVNLRLSLKPLVYLFEDGISPGHKRRIEAVIESAHPHVRIIWVKPDISSIANLRPSPWNSRATYLRLFIPAMLPPEHKRVIYLDSDVIVEGDLGDLWRQDLQGRLVLAVENFSDPIAATALTNTYQALGLDPDTPYFNAGILVINLERWRSDQIAARVITFLEQYRDRAPYADQDGLNAIIAGDWAHLHPSWNVQLNSLRHFGRHNLDVVERTRIQSQLLRRPAILHYTGRRKPWNWLYKGFAARAFSHYLGQSGWLDTPRYRAWALSRHISHFGTWCLGMLKGGLRALSSS